MSPLNESQTGTFDAIVLAVNHDQYRNMVIDAIRASVRVIMCFAIMKYLFSAEEIDLRL
ncbi:hypothetical protein FE848_03030 [Marinobacter sp. 1-3A]|uniref:hypothetical protein n=1 Tax=Marinobacter sp. 1-3A TaxID=2582920 RepID=UPI001908049D|nr:hypothetical protein [Marinobacter sp. 1-3A]MBK1872184.1 hypothetical protein [Marinobacter sp. 1-3A]